MGLGRARVLVLVLVVGSGALADAADEEAPKFNLCNDVGETTDLPRLQVGQCHFNDATVVLCRLLFRILSILLAPFFSSRKTSLCH